jgi:hypothetical protein
VQAPGGGAAAQAQPWGIEIATAFSKEEAREEFGHVKQDHADIIGSYDPILIEQCDLHMGTRVQYSARIGAASREDADALCAKLMASRAPALCKKTRKPLLETKGKEAGFCSRSSASEFWPLAFWLMDLAVSMSEGRT